MDLWWPKKNDEKALKTEKYLDSLFNKSFWESFLSLQRQNPLRFRFGFDYKGKSAAVHGKKSVKWFFRTILLKPKKMVDRHNAYVYWNVCFWTDSWRTIFWFTIRIHLPSELLVEHLFPFSSIHRPTFFSSEFFVQLVTHCDDSSE